jgi:MFS superfamily sulfate permease-like transporter
VARACPRCGSERTRRGGHAIWMTYLVLMAAAMVAVLMLHLHAGIVAAIMLAVIVLAHLILDQRVCLHCGEQWRRTP